MVAGAATIGMIPFTWTCIVGVNEALFVHTKHERDGKTVDLAAVRRLVGLWRRLNLLRMLFPLSGSILGMLAICGTVVY